MTRTTTSRGFNIFGEIIGRHGDRMVVQESSLAFEGAHARIFLKDGQTGNPTDAFHFNVAQAKEIIVALQAFVTMAENDELTEPAEWTREATIRRGPPAAGMGGERMTEDAVE